MKHILAVTALGLLSATTAADEINPSNPVVRPITLADGEVALGGAFAVELENGNDLSLGLNAAYGLTEDLTVGLDGLRYRLLERANDGVGLELVLAGGLRGYRESAGDFDDAFAWGVDFAGKYVLSEQTAVTFAASYLVWNEDNRDNRNEYQFSVGAMQQIANKVTLKGGYTYSILNDFVADDSHSVSIGVDYAYSEHTNVGLFSSYTNFDATENGYSEDGVYESALGAYVTYRF